MHMLLEEHKFLILPWLQFRDSFNVWFRLDYVLQFNLFLNLNRVKRLFIWFDNLFNSWQIILDISPLERKIRPLFLLWGQSLGVIMTLLPKFFLIRQPITPVFLPKLDGILVLGFIGRIKDRPNIILKGFINLRVMLFEPGYVLFFPLSWLPLSDEL